MRTGSKNATHAPLGELSACFTAYHDVKVMDAQDRKVEAGRDPRYFEVTAE
jgi:hypothetical protein